MRTECGCGAAGPVRGAHAVVAPGAVTHACGSGAAGAEQTAPHFVAGCKRVWLAKLFTTRNKVLWGLFSLLLRSELQTGADGEQGMDGVSLDKGKIPTTSLKKKKTTKKVYPFVQKRTQVIEKP